MQDPFLRRKLCDTFRFAFLGFITTVELKDENPGLVKSYKTHSKALLL